jgi:hypothetical protein
MCYYISFAVSSEIERRAHLLLSANLELQPNHNRSFRALIPHTFRPYFLTTEICSCELYEKTESHMYGFRSDVQHYFHRLSKHTKNIFLHIHFYRSDIEKEKIPVISSQTLTIKNMMTTQIDQDCFYQILFK